MLRHQRKHQRRRQQAEITTLDPTTSGGQSCVNVAAARYVALPRMTWTSVVTEGAIADRPLSRNPELRIRPLLDDPRLRRAMGLDAVGTDVAAELAVAA